MIVSVSICLASFIWLVVLLRRQGTSVGLPIAYLFILLFIHVPGAIAHIVGEEFLSDTDATKIGIRLTAIGSVCFVAGVWIFRSQRETASWTPMQTPQRNFPLFCLVAGLGVTYSLRALVSIPSLGAVIEKAGGIWMLGALIGLQIAVWEGNIKKVAQWLAAMGIYPILTLLLGGFLSFGSTPIFIILASLVVSVRNNWRIAIGVPLVTIVFLTLFLSYFQNRNDIRDAVWGGESMQVRIERSMNIFFDVQVFNPKNVAHLKAFDLRLNQNYFVGRSAMRIENGTVDFLHGRSFWEGAIALVPRAIWPDKPVVAGSPKVIMEMTGFVVNDSTSYGVGNVMEFYINFGVPSLVAGFLLLGGLFAWLDHSAAVALGSRNMGQALIYFMPAAAMIHPNGSLVELTSGGAAALVAAFGWRWLWMQWNTPSSHNLA